MAQIWSEIPLKLAHLDSGINRRVFSRAQLLDSAHDEARDVSDRAIDSHIKNIRCKISAVAPDCPGITSVYGVGYRVDVPEKVTP